MPNSFMNGGAFSQYGHDAEVSINLLSPGVVKGAAASKYAPSSYATSTYKKPAASEMGDVTRPRQLAADFDAARSAHAVLGLDPKSQVVKLTLALEKAKKEAAQTQAALAASSPLPAGHPNYMAAKKKRAEQQVTFMQANSRSLKLEESLRTWQAAVVQRQQQNDANALTSNGWKKNLAAKSKAEKEAAQQAAREKAAAEKLAKEAEAAADREAAAAQKAAKLAGSNAPSPPPTASASDAAEAWAKFEKLSISDSLAAREAAKWTAGSMLAISPPLGFPTYAASKEAKRQNILSQERAFASQNNLDNALFDWQESVAAARTVPGLDPDSKEGKRQLAADLAAKVKAEKEAAQQAAKQKAAAEKAAKEAEAAASKEKAAAEKAAKEAEAAVAREKAAAEKVAKELAAKLKAAAEKAAKDAARAAKNNKANPAAETKTTAASKEAAKEALLEKGLETATKELLAAKDLLAHHMPLPVGHPSYAASQKVKAGKKTALMAATSKHIFAEEALKSFRASA